MSPLNVNMVLNLTFLAGSSIGAINSSVVQRTNADKDAARVFGRLWLNLAENRYRHR